MPDKFDQKALWSRRVSAIKKLKDMPLSVVLKMYPEDAAWIEKNKAISHEELMALVDKALV